MKRHLALLISAGLVLVAGTLLLSARSAMAGSYDLDSSYHNVAHPYGGYRQGGLYRGNNPGGIRFSNRRDARYNRFYPYTRYGYPRYNRYYPNYGNSYTGDRYNNPDYTVSGGDENSIADSPSNTEETAD